MKLADTQRWLVELIRAPEGVARALEAQKLPPARLAQVVVGATDDEAVERLDVYANMYFFRILEALGIDYPRLAARLGHDSFSDVVTDYLLAHPSHHPSLREIGAALPAFLLAASETVPAWAADLARLERAHLEVFDRVDQPLLEWATLQTLPPEAFATLPLQAVTSLALIDVTYDVEALWATGGEASEDQTDPEAAALPGTVLVWRYGNSVRHRRLDADELAHLDQARAGISFGMLCEQLATAVEDPAAAAFALLGRWVVDGLLVDRTDSSAVDPLQDR